MNDFGSALQPYNLTEALAADRGDDCIVLNVGHNEHSQPVYSLKHVLEQVERHLTLTHSTPCAATKLYIMGDWILTECDAEHEENLNLEAQEVKVSDYRTSIALKLEQSTRGSTNINSEAQGRCRKLGQSHQEGDGAPRTDGQSAGVDVSQHPLHVLPPLMNIVGSPDYHLLLQFGKSYLRH
jgi:hypothetical protein